MSVTDGERPAESESDRGGAPTRRVAVCFSGIPRNASQNLKFIRAFLAGSDADVFFHFWESPDGDAVVRSLAPKRYVFESRVHAPAAPVPFRREKFVPPSREGNIASMLYSLKRANEMKREYEDAHDFRYDVVVRARLDFFSATSLAEIVAALPIGAPEWDRTLYLPDMAHASGINDQMAIGSSRTMDTYSAASDALADFAAKNYFNSEYFLLRYVQSSGLHIRVFPFEYVLLRDDPMSTFDLPGNIAFTVEWWWSAPLPPIPPSVIDAYFAAKADSVRLVDELDCETAHVHRLRSRAHGYLRYDPRSRRSTFVSTPAAASRFFLVVAEDKDRNMINIRPRESVMRRGGRAFRMARTNLAPDRDRVVRGGALPDAGSSFLIGGSVDAGLTFEWYPGYWTTPGADPLVPPRTPGGRAAIPDDAVPTGQRMFLGVRDGGLAIVPAEQALVFDAEPVRDPAAEASGVGLRLHEQRYRAAGSTLGQMLHLSYHAVRYWEERGTSAVVQRGTSILRRRVAGVTRRLRGRP